MVAVITHHHENFRPVALAKGYLVIDKLNNPVMTSKSFEQFYLIRIALIRFCVCAFERHPLESVNDPLGRTDD